MIRDLIREELKKYINENQNDDLQYSGCTRFSGDEEKHKLCRRIISTQGWLSKHHNYNLQDVIDEILEPIKSPYTEEQKNKFVKGAKLLFDLGKISKGRLYYFIEDNIKNSKLVLINGEWHPVNKLNTNYADLAELITDLLYKSERSLPIRKKILQNPKEGLMMIKPKIKKLLEKYFKDPTLYYDYVKNINYRSKIGEDAENNVKNKLEEKGFELLYQGGEGDLIDMTFGVDLIMSHPETGPKTIQVKSNESWDKSLDYKYCDWIIVSEPFTIYDNKTKEVVEL
jgi:hypothetical protein